MGLNKYFWIVSVIILIPVSLSFAQHDIKVRNVRFETLGDMVIIRYDLDGNPNKKCEIYLLLSHDYGKNFSTEPKSVKGEIGRGVRPGSDKEIIWNKKKDFPYGLLGGGYVFAVDAEIQKPPNYFPYILVGGVIGTFAILTYKQSKPTGITISVPVEY